MKSAITAGTGMACCLCAGIDAFHLQQVFQMRIDSSGLADHPESYTPCTMIVLAPLSPRAESLPQPLVSGDFDRQRCTHTPTHTHTHKQVFAGFKKCFRPIEFQERWIMITV